MIGANWSIFGCSRSRSESGVSIFKELQGENKWSSKWRKSIINLVTKDRVIDKALRERIMIKAILSVKDIILIPNEFFVSAVSCFT